MRPKGRKTLSRPKNGHILSLSRGAEGGALSLNLPEKTQELSQPLKLTPPILKTIHNVSPILEPV